MKFPIIIIQSLVSVLQCITWYPIRNSIFHLRFFSRKWFDDYLAVDIIYWPDSQF